MGNVSSKVEFLKRIKRKCQKSETKILQALWYGAKKKNASKQKTTVTEMNTAFHGVNSRLDKAKDRTSMGDSLTCC